MVVERVELLGLVAAALTTGSFAPQVLRTWRDGGANLSNVMLGCFLAGVMLWLVYGVATSAMSVVVANVLTAVQVLVILAIKRARASSERRPAR